MRILFLLTQDLESPSGLGRYWPMAKALAKRGHQVRIAALHSNWSSLTNRRFVQEGVHVVYVAPMHIIKKGNEKIYYSTFQLIWVTLRATWALYREALSYSADIIHVGKPHPMNSIAGLLSSRLKRSYLCLDCDDYEAGSNRFSGRWQQTGITFFEERMPRKVRLITTNTYYMKSKLLEWGCPDQRIFYLSNGIDRERFTLPNPVEVERLRVKLGLEGKRIILYMGSLSLVNHPVNLLLQAFVQISHEFPDAVLLLAGGGEDYQRLIDQSGTLGIKKLTHFVGRLEPVEVPLYYCLADVSVDPVNDDEAARGRSPLKLFESWACGVPFVTAAVGDRSLLIGQPPAGMLIDHAGDPNALAAGIVKILESEDLAKELRRRGLEQVEKYTWDHLAAQLEVEYQSIR